MKFYATSFCRTKRVDAYVENLILKTLVSVGKWERTPVNQADIVIYVFTWTQEWDFDQAEFEAVAKRNIPLFVFDYLEGEGTPIAMGGIINEHLSRTHLNIHTALSSIPIAKYFKREMVKDWPTLRFPTRPIDFVVDDYLDQNRVDTEAEFMARPVNVMMIWGSSSGSRPLLAGELIKQLDRFRSYPCFALQLGDLEYNVRTQNFNPIAILYQNGFWNRIPMSKLLAIQRQAKISISCRGVGRKCFRSAEAGYNAILAQQDLDLLQWSFPWHSMPCGRVPTYLDAPPNAINLPSKPGSLDIDEKASVDELHRLVEIDAGWLYPIYKAGVENNQNYVAANYIVRYLIPEICATL